MQCKYITIYLHPFTSCLLFTNPFSRSALSLFWNRRDFSVCTIVCQTVYFWPSGVGKVLNSNCEPPPWNVMRSSPTAGEIGRVYAKKAPRLQMRLLQCRQASPLHPNSEGSLAFTSPRLYDIDKDGRTEENISISNYTHYLPTCSLTLLRHYNSRALLCSSCATPKRAQLFFTLPLVKSCGTLLCFTNRGLS